MMIEMELVEIQIGDPSTPQVILLQEKGGERAFPIYIGLFEAAALDQTVRGFQPPRPMTHDLVMNVIEGMGGTLSGVCVDELSGDTFIGKLLVKTGDGTVERIDSRPSDAIVLAMKAKAPIYVEDEVLDATTRGDDDDEPPAEPGDDEGDDLFGANDTEEED